MEPLKDRFWRKVDKTTTPDGCWTWKRCKMGPGYGRIYIEGKISQAHRVAWELTYGPIPVGLDVCHTCDNPSCVNPAHLFQGTRRENNIDCINKGRGNRSLLGEDNGRAKLTRTQVLEIKNSKLSDYKLALRYGVSRWAIWNIQKGISWKTKGGVPSNLANGMKN